MIKAIFFDFDGVIVESVDIKTRAFGVLFAEHGEDIARRVVDYHVANAGISRYEKFKYIYKEILKKPLTDRVFEALCGRFSSLVADNVIAAPYVKGAREFLEKGCRRYACFIISATPGIEIEDIIAKRRDYIFFKKIIGAPIDKKDAVKNILSQEGIMPGEAAYVGDAMSDYEAARDNGVHFIARIRDNETAFRGVDCPKIRDLTPLEEELEYLRNNE